MSIKCNDTQLVLLSAASQRDDNCLVPPAGPKRAQAQRAVAKLLEAGLVNETRAKAGGPIWRRDGETGQTYALKLTAAGAKAIAVDETGPSEGEAERRPDHPIFSVDPKANPPGKGQPTSRKRALHGVRRRPSFLLAVGDENEMNVVGHSGNRQKTATAAFAAFRLRQRSQNCSVPASKVRIAADQCYPRAELLPKEDFTASKL